MGTLFRPARRRGDDRGRFAAVGGCAAPRCRGTVGTEDDRFIDLVADAARRPDAMRGWARSRRWSFVAAGLFLLLSIAAFFARMSAICGLFAGVSAINFAAAISMDMRIKLALLAARLLPPAPTAPTEPTAPAR